jgi:hypothetical protein
MAYGGSGEEQASWPYYTWLGGYYWLGYPRVPPPAPLVGLIDSVTGLTYYLFWDGAQHFGLTTQPPPNVSTKIYKPGDGPFIEGYGLRLGVANDHLTMDSASGSSGSPVFAFNPLQPFQQSYPRPSNYPVQAPPPVPGVPSSTPPPTLVGYPQFEQQIATFPVLPPRIVPMQPAGTATSNPNTWNHAGSFVP